MVASSSNSPRIPVTYIQRKRRPNANFSLEFIFEDVRRRLTASIESKVIVAPCFSNGFFRRLAIAVFAWWHRGPVNHVTGDINFAGILLPRQNTVLTILDCGFLERSSGIRRTVLRLFWLTLPVRRSAVITTISQAAKAEITKYSGCDPERIRVIPVAVSERFKPVPARPFPECPRILQIGTAPNKNLLRVIAALDGIPCVLVVIGQLNQDVQLQALRHGVRIENAVNLTESEIVQQYEQSDLVVFASTLEGFGMPIIEAQSVGRPVVTSNVSSMPEVAGAGACFVDPGDVASIREGLLRVIRDGAYRQQLINAGFENAWRFDPQRIALQYQEIYQGLMNPPNQ